MNMRLWLKLIFILAMLLFMVMMGISNNDLVQFKLKPLGFESEKTRAAIMYFIFFGAGVVTGAILLLGPWKSSRGK